MISDHELAYDNPDKYGYLYWCASFQLHNMAANHIYKHLHKVSCQLLFKEAAYSF